MTAPATPPELLDLKLRQQLAQPGASPLASSGEWGGALLTILVLFLVVGCVSQGGLPGSPPASPVLATWTPAATATPPATKTPLPTPTFAATMSPTPRLPLASPPAAVPTPSPTGDLGARLATWPQRGTIVGTGRDPLRIRETTDANAAIVGRLAPGARILVLRPEGSERYLIMGAGVQGYVPARYVQLEGSV